MRFALMTEPQQGLSYDEVLACARTAEAAGFEAFFRSDHYASFPGAAGKPTTDCWATLAGLARETRTIRFGPLVSPVTFRIPGAFAKMAITVDEMSGGRLEVGVGAGWNEIEHRQHGLPFPDIGERADMLEEELQMLHGFWDEPDGWSFKGRHWQVGDALFRPKWVPRPDGRKRPPILIGGNSARSLRLAAAYADEYNVSSSAARETGEIYARLADACRAAGRDPETLTRSAMAGVLIGRDQAEVRERVHAQLEMFGESTDEAEAWLAERRSRWIIGTPDEARARLAEFEAVGVQRLMLQTLLPRDLDHIKLMGEVVFA